MRKMERAAKDVADLAANARDAARSLREARAAAQAAPPGSPAGARSAGGGGGAALDAVLQRLGAIQATLGQVSANVSGTAAAARLAERQAGG